MAQRRVELLKFLLEEGPDASVSDRCVARGLVRDVESALRGEDPPRLDAAEVRRTVLTRVPALGPSYESALDTCIGPNTADGDICGLALVESLDLHTRALLRDHDEGATGDGLREWLDAAEQSYGHGLDGDFVVQIGILLHFICLPAEHLTDLGPRTRSWVDHERAWRAEVADGVLVRGLVRELPALAPLAEDAGWGPDGEVLVHAFLSELARREVAFVLAAALEEPKRVAGLLGALHSGLVGADAGDVGPFDEAIEVSFLEQLPSLDEPGADIWGLLGPKLVSVALGQTWRRRGWLRRLLHR